MEKLEGSLQRKRQQYRTEYLTKKKLEELQDEILLKLRGKLEEEKRLRRELEERLGDMPEFATPTPAVTTTWERLPLLLEPPVPLWAPQRPVGWTPTPVAGQRPHNIPREAYPGRGMKNLGKSSPRQRPGETGILSFGRTRSGRLGV